MADPMRIRANLAGDETTVRVLMNHIMESGLRKDASGNTIPAHYITDVQATHQGKVVMKAAWSTAVSQNPYLQFKFKGGAKGEKVEVTWKDTKGESRTDSGVIA